MVQSNGKMLIASSSTIVGVMKSHATARSDIPAGFTKSPRPTTGMATGAGSVISILVSTTLVLCHTVRSHTLANARVPASRTPAESRSMHRRVPVLRDLVVQYAKRNRSSRHLQRGGEVSDKRSCHAQTPALQPSVRRVEEEIELAQRRASQPVDQQQQIRTFCGLEIIDNTLEQLVANRLGGSELGSAPARLTVNAHPYFHLVIANLEGRHPGRGHDATGEGNAHGRRL